MDTAAGNATYGACYKTKRIIHRDPRPEIIDQNHMISLNTSNFSSNVRISRELPDRNFVNYEISCFVT
jgi:hypothetical protein